MSIKVLFFGLCNEPTKMSITYIQLLDLGLICGYTLHVFNA